VRPGPAGPVLPFPTPCLVHFSGWRGTPDGTGRAGAPRVTHRETMTPVLVVAAAIVNNRVAP